MATIEKLNSISASKAAIKAAIQEKGVSCDDTLAEYANRIKAIPTGAPTSEINLGGISFDVGENTTFKVPSGYCILDIHGTKQSGWQTDFSMEVVHINVAQPTTKYELLKAGSLLYLIKWEEDASQNVTLTNLQQITI